MWSNLEHSAILIKTGQQLRTIRKTLGYSQEKASEMSGISRVTIGKIEQGKDFNFDSFIRLLRAYGILDRMENLLTPPTSSIFQKYLDNDQG